MKFAVMKRGWTRRLVFAGLLLVAAEPADTPYERKLDLQSAIDLALRQNRELVRSALSVDRARWSVRKAQSSFALRVRPDSNIGFDSEQNSFDYGLGVSRNTPLGTRYDVASRVTRTQPEDQDDIQRTTVAIGLRQPLFRNFGRLVNLDHVVQANQTLASVRRDYQQQRANLIVDVVETFETILRLRAQFDGDRASFERAQKLHRLTRAREKQGRVSRVDTLRVELQRGQARARLESSREALTFAEQAFAELLGFRPDTRFELVPPPRLKLDLPPVEQAVHVALENRLDYAQAIEDHRDQRRDVRIARRNLQPDLSLVARYERFGEGDGFSDTTELDESRWFLGLAAGTEFNPVRERSALREAMIAADSSREAVELIELIIAREVRERMTAYRKAQTELKIAERNFNLARGRVRLARRLFQLGRGDHFSVTDAEEAFIEAEIQLLSSRAEASVSGYRLKRALGTLIDYPDDLKPQPLAGTS